jgi:hypothetical protein
LGSRVDEVKKDDSKLWTTLEEYVISLFERKMTDSEEFKALINLYGRAKIVEIWNKFKGK